MMLKPNLVRHRVNPAIGYRNHIYTTRWTVIIMLVMAVSACAGNTTTPVPDPTQSLIVFTPEPSAFPVTPTVTAVPPPAAGELLQTPRTTDTSTEDQTEMISATETDLANHLDLDDVSDLQLVLYEAVHWQGESLECESVPLRLTTQGFEGLRVVYLYDEMIYTYRTGESEFMRCEEVSSLQAPPDVIVLIDPVAADQVSLAQRRIAQDLDISSRLINVDSVEVRVWEDTSLGCPTANQNYDPIETNGYRIVLTAGENSYIFHASFDRLILCQDEPIELDDTGN